MWEYAIPFVAYLLRRYRSQKYSTQKFSRRCDYMEKSQLSPLKVSWNVKYEEYKPKGRIDETRLWWFDLTRVDGKIRFLVEVSPYIFCRVPYNPFGRTGVVGKGLFPRTGPHNMTMTIIWSRTLGFLKLAYIKKGKLLYMGYLDHPMNTDNAWIDAAIYLFDVQEFSGVPEECPEWLATFVKDINKIPSK